jgi:hypothetical protein
MGQKLRRIRKVLNPTAGNIPQAALACITVYGCPGRQWGTEFHTFNGNQNESPVRDSRTGLFFQNSTGPAIFLPAR